MVQGFLCGGDDWLNDVNNPRLMGPCDETTCDMKFAELLVEGGGAWNSGKLTTIFLQSDGDISQSPGGDIFRWQHAKDGLYKVKLGYWNCMESLQNTIIRREEDWRDVWRLDVAPKIHFFLWKVHHDILPTCKINLISRFVDLDPYCPHCGTELETMEHVLRDCSWAKEVWEGAGFDVKVAQGGPFWEWFRRLLHTTDSNTCPKLVTLIWFIWYERIFVVFGRRLKCPPVVHAYVCAFHAEYLEVWW